MTTFTLPFVPALPRVGFGRIAKAAQTEIAKRRIARSMSHMDAHMMRDIGLTPPADDLHTLLFRAMLYR